MRFVIFPRANQHGRRWYFHARADGNNEIVLRSEGYHNLADAQATVALIRTEAARSPVHIQEKTR